jgi:nicotinamidase-related amidase
MNPPTIDLKFTALVLIDLQKGIAGRDLAPHSGASVVANAAKLAVRFRAAQAPVVLVNVNFAPDFGDAVKVDVDQQAQMPAMAPDWAEIVPELDPQPGDLHITKHQWGAFYGTELDLQLRRRGIRKIVLGGIATHIGVESTARAANEHGYAQVFAEDAMSSMSAETHAFSVKHIFPRIGQVRSTAEILAGCAATPK